MTLPDFLLIGAPKAGTTTINIALNQHPDIFMCPKKESGFFWAYGDTTPIRGPGKAVTNKRVIYDLDLYQKLFSGIKNEKRVGESSVRYISHPRAPELIHQFIPNAQLIAVLRQPADRAFSSYLHALREGVEPCSNFMDAIKQERQGLRDDWNTVRHLHPGFYYQSLTHYQKYFDRDQMYISLFEDLKEDAPKLIARIFRFLDVDDIFKPDLTHRHNASGVIRNPITRWLWAKSIHVRALIRPYLDDKFKHSMYEWLIRDMDKPVLLPQVRSEITGYFRKDIENLQDLLDRDLSHWLVTI